MSSKIPLTPGPLVVVLKDTWPPRTSTAVETIAASFVPPLNGSAVRLFNLAADLPAADLSNGNGTILASHIKYVITRWLGLDIF